MLSTLLIIFATYYVVGLIATFLCHYFFDKVNFGTYEPNLRDFYYYATVAFMAPLSVFIAVKRGIKFFRGETVI